MIRKALAGLAVAVVAALSAVALFTNHSYVTTPSMYPTIPPGSEIFVVHRSHYRVGQVIEFKANGLIWAHRLIAVKPNGDMVTKGDNPLNSPDVFLPPVTAKSVVGAVEFAPRWIGFPELILHHPAYGLAWMRAELGLAGRIAIVAAVAALAFLVASRRPNQRRLGSRSPAGEDRSAANYLAA